mgnify:CR=1 FL=1
MRGIRQIPVSRLCFHGRVEGVQSGPFRIEGDSQRARRRYPPRGLPAGRDEIYIKNMPSDDEIRAKKEFNAELATAKTFQDYMRLADAAARDEYLKDPDLLKEMLTKASELAESKKDCFELANAVDGDLMDFEWAFKIRKEHDVFSEPE